MATVPEYETAKTAFCHSGHLDMSQWNEAVSNDGLNSSFRQILMYTLAQMAFWDCFFPIIASDYLKNPRLLSSYEFMLQMLIK